MRGKLRDKRVETRHDKLKRELVVRRRNTRRGNRTAVAIAWQNQLLLDEDYDFLLKDDQEQAIENAKN